jgi:hypothetical protein
MRNHVHDPERSLATAMVGNAIKDMHHKKLISITDHVGAVCWLGSKGSTKWFDVINIDQEASLPKLRWDIYAKDILSDDEILLSDDQRDMLTSTLKHFQQCKA